MSQNLVQNTSADPRSRSLVSTLLGNHFPCSHLNFKTTVIEWTWDVRMGNNFVEVVNNARDVTFHRKHSSGTAVVRGTEPMSHGQHFWEIEMTSPVYGTDMMVGIGTPEADMSQLQDTFISRLGNDSHTWGFSYTGSFYHNGESRVISSAFDQGSIIGLHLDMWNGTLSFYKNKKHLGVISKGLKGKTLYAMASSTAACSGMRILRSCSFPSSLQFLCCAKLRNIIPDDKCVLDELPTLPPGLRLFLENNLMWLLKPRLNEEHHPLKDIFHKTADNYWSFDFPGESYDSYYRISRDSNYHFSPFLTEPDMNFIIVGRRSSASHLLQDCNRFQRAGQSNRESNIVINTAARHHIARNSCQQSGASQSNSESNIVVDTAAQLLRDHSHNQRSGVSQSNPESSTETPTTAVEEDFFVKDDDDDSLVSEAKRRKYSYNYAVGLSDPDSDTES